MAAVMVADRDEVVGVDCAVVVRERLEAFAEEVLAEAVNRPVQMVNGGLYLRGLIEQGERKSLEPIVEWLGEEADYHSMQQFLADSPWDPVLVVGSGRGAGVAAGRCARRGCSMTPAFPKDGKDSPGVKRQYSGTLGKTGNCQIGVSVHAVGAGRDGAPWAGRCICPRSGVRIESAGARRRSPRRCTFKTKPELGVELIERAAGWEVRRAPMLGDCAYGEQHRAA